MAGGFDALGLDAAILRAVGELGWNLPTDIQDEAIPLILGGGDVMAAAETGSGKTAAFCLPILQCVHEWLKGKSQAKASDDNVMTVEYDIKLSDSDKDSIVNIENDGLKCTSHGDKVWGGGRADHGVKGNGKYYYEVTIIGNGICRFGWSTMAGHHELGKDLHGFGYGGTGMKSYNSNFEAYGIKYSDNDVVGCYLDLDEGHISYSVNGKFLGKAFSLSESVKGSVLFPAYVLKGGSAQFNYGPTFKHSSVDDKGVTYQSIIIGNSNNIVNASSREAYIVEGKRLPLAVILVPSRELAEQVFRDLESLSKFIVDPDIKSVLLVGGDDSKRQQKIISRGVDIAIGTIGRVSELVKSSALSFSQVRFFVLDEADRMVDSQNIDSVMSLYNACPGGGSGENRLQVCFFSATLHSPDITNLAAKICQNPTWVDLKGVDSVPETVHHVVYRVDTERDAHLLQNATKAVLDDVHVGNISAADPEYNSYVVKQLKQHILLGIIDKFNMSQCIIFCRTNLDCDNLETFLMNHGGANGKKFKGQMESGKENPYSCCVLAGMRDMNERRRNLEAFKEGVVRFIICTDVAARGIDIKNLAYCINMTLPDKAEDYVHRIGRVGRAECMGLAISIIAPSAVKEKVWFHKCTNRGKGCSNRKDADKGGCTIQYDEAAIFQAIEERIHFKVPIMDASYNLPPELAELNTQYGEDMLSGEVGVSGNYHSEQLLPSVKQLATLEHLSQNNFLMLQSQFGIL